MAASELAQSEWLTALLALLNVAQVVWLADISARSRRVRRRHDTISSEPESPDD
jgi:hypothetical protein